MNTATYHLELITPCFCGGAKSDQEAEIRAPSIRGQLRWWFRTLGGFKSLSQQRMSVRQQEDFVFGNAAGNSGAASKLLVRVCASTTGAIRGRQTMGRQEVQSRPGETYVLWPLAQNVRDVEGNRVENRKAYVAPSSVGFRLQVTWRGPSSLWPGIEGLLAVFGHLGALGFRSRRAMGALAFGSDPPSLKTSLTCFAQPGAIDIRELLLKAGEQPVAGLAAWLRDWRAYLHPVTQQPNSGGKGFQKALSDHNAGYAVANRTNLPPQPTFRAALGLPIQQRLSKANATVVWNEHFDPEKARKDRRYLGEGRFASPVLLRPYRKVENGQTTWHALVIFVESHKWPEGQPVYLNGQKRAVSLDLYDAMKKDPDLKSLL